MNSPENDIWAFEPQIEYFGLLRHNTEGHFNICCFSEALGSFDGVIEISTVPLDKVAAPGEPGLEKTTAFVKTLDSVCAERFEQRIALIKIDVDGKELDILKGAEGTIDKWRPILFVEYDRPENATDLPAWIHTKKYRIYRVTPRLYNPDNFRKNPINVFGNLESCMLLCVPQERYDLRADTFGFPVDRVRVTK